MKLFADQPYATAETVAQALTIMRTTSRRCTEYCASQRGVAEIIHGEVGRPQRIYRGGWHGCRCRGDIFPRPATSAAGASGKAPGTIISVAIMMINRPTR